MILSTSLRRISLVIIFLSINSYASASSIPHMVKDINPNGSADIRDVTEMNGELFFTATDGINGRALWRSDGTEEGTVMIKDINPSNDNSTDCGPEKLTIMNGTLFFTAGDMYYFDMMNQHLECNNELWKSDGTAQGTVLVKDIQPQGYSSDPRALTALDDTLFFTAIESSHSGRELWKSDGTEEGTVMIKDIDPYPGSSSMPDYLTAVNNTLYFGADNGELGRELWKSDGTEEGTTLVKEINPRNDWFGGHAYPKELTNINDMLFFIATDGTHGQKVWKSDGTEVGTVMIKGTDTDDPIYNNPFYITGINDFIYFVAWAYVDGQPHLWKSDGTETGLFIVREDMRISPTRSYEINGMLYFFITSQQEQQLWKSDGTDLGTVMVKNINRGEPTGLFLSNIIDVNGTAFFLATDEAHGGELWKSDGTAAGTVMVADINPGSTDSRPSELLYHNDILYFQADDGINGPELWALPAPTETDEDAIPDGDDNCPLVHNPNQEDTYPPQGNGIGDACDCEADFDCNGNVDALDAMNFLWDFGRGAYYDPCTNARWCYGDFDCNGAVDADDVDKFLEDFGRSHYFNPCPACVVRDWCSY